MRFSFTDPIYGITVKVLIRDADKLTDEDLEYIGEDDLDYFQNIKGSFFSFEETAIVAIWLNEWNNDIESRRTLIHECQHILQCIESSFGIDGEASAYYLEYVYATIETMIHAIQLHPEEEKIKEWLNDEFYNN